MKFDINSESQVGNRLESHSGQARLDLPPNFIELLPVAAYACDESGRVLWFNTRAVDLWGRAPRIGDDTELFCGSYKLIFGGQEISRLETPMAVALRTGEAIHGAEGIVERPDGSRVWATVHIDPVKDAAGKVLGAINCFHDTTELHQARADASEREARTRGILEAMPAAVYTTDAVGRITYFNQAVTKLAGREPTLGSDEWCVTWKLYLPDGTPLPHDECPMALALNEKRPNSGMEAIAERPDGSRVPFIAYPTPLFDASGELTGAVNMLVDISERKASEEALRKSEEQLSAELKAARQLQAISTQLVHERDTEGLYEKIIDAAVSIMRSDFASMQMFHPKRGEKGELELLAFRGFDPEAAKFWEWVRADSGCTCGEAMRTGRRAIAADVETCDFMAGTPDRTAYLEAGMLAAQSTPLVSRSGRLLGMISTHWRDPHDPSEGDLRRFDVLVRQAADLIERAQAEVTQRESEERLRLIVESANEYAIITLDAEGRVASWNSGAQRILGFENGEVIGRRAHIFYTPEDVAAGRPEIEMRCARSEGRSTNERWHARKDGSHFWASGVTLPLANGIEGGFLLIFRDRTEERRAEEALRDSEEFKRRIIESTEDCIKMLDLEGRLLWISHGGQQALEIRDIDAVVGTSWIDLWPGDDRIVAKDAIRSSAGGRTSRFSGWMPTMAGRDKYWDSIITPILASNGMPERLLAVTRDITERKRSEEQRTLLVNELNHRVKNTLATVQSMASQTLRNSQDTEHARRRFESRLMALSGAHDILTQENWEGASLRKIVEEVAPHCGQGSERFDIEGPDVWVTPKYALALAMALHELCTNAVKYGALSNDEGRVQIEWAIAGMDGTRELHMRWTEKDGPPVKPPSRRGFGSRLVERGLKQDLGGDVKIEFAPAGVICKIDAPLAHAGDSDETPAVVAR